MLACCTRWDWCPPACAHLASYIKPASRAPESSKISGQCTDRQRTGPTHRAGAATGPRGWSVWARRRAQRASEDRADARAERGTRCEVRCRRRRRCHRRGATSAGAARQAARGRVGSDISWQRGTTAGHSSEPGCRPWLHSGRAARVLVRDACATHGLLCARWRERCWRSSCAHSARQ